MSASIVSEVAAIVIASTAIPLLYRKIIDVTSQATDRQVVAHDLMVLVGLLTLALVATNMICRRISNFSLISFRANVTRDLTRSVFETLQKHSYSFFSNEFAGALVSKQNRFIGGFEQVYSFFLFTVIDSSIGLASSIIVLAFVSPLLCVLFVAWAIIFIGAVMWLTPKQRTRNLARAVAQSRLTALFADVLSNILTVKAFAGESSEKQLMNERSQDSYEKLLWARQGRARINLVQTTLTTLLQGGLMIVAVLLWIRGEISAGTIVLIQIYLVRAAETVWSIGRDTLEFQSAVDDAQEMAKILDMPTEVSDPSKPEPSRIASGMIRFDDVTFAYDSRRSIFEHFDLTVRSGEKIALVGHSGAGKTTITKLLLRFLDVQAGAVTIDGQDIRWITQEDLRRNIGYVSQEPLLFHRTLRENITYGNPDASELEIEEAAKKARAHDFIVALPNGYETLVGERGIKLSGGERQRVAIARAMLKNAPILVLDEATSSLDSESEKHIQEALDEAMKGRTTLVIAHRLSTIRKMDRILVFEEGKVIEEGSHEDLIAKGGVYSSLWNQQSGGFIADPEELTATT